MFLVFSNNRFGFREMLLIIVYTTGIKVLEVKKAKSLDINYAKWRVTVATTKIICIISLGIGRKLSSPKTITTFQFFKL
jgi:hypothetical protein